MRSRPCRKIRDVFGKIIALSATGVERFLRWSVLFDAGAWRRPDRGELGELPIFDHAHIGGGQLLPSAGGDLTAHQQNPLVLWLVVDRSEFVQPALRLR